jgi:tetratricopeptide (TPR) repeat protein
LYDVKSLHALIEMKKGNYDEAIKYFSESDPKDPYIWYYEGLTYKKKGDKDNATKCFKKVVQSNINSQNLALVRPLAMAELK